MNTRSITQKFLFSFAILALVISTSACGFTINAVRGSGKVVSETREVSGYHGVALSGVGEVTLTQGDTESLKIEAEDNLMPYLVSEVKNGVLHLGIQDQPRVSIRPTQSIKFTVMVKDLDSLDLSGAGNINAGEVKSTNDFHISTSGAGNINLKSLAAKNLDLDTSGLGSITISGGKVDAQNISISGMGSYSAENLQSQSASVDISGAGNITVWVAENLDADLSGAGSVSYYGSPSVSQDISGAGKMTKLGDK